LWQHEHERGHPRIYVYPPNVVHDPPAVNKHMREICIIFRRRFFTSGDLDLSPFQLTTGIPVIPGLGNIHANFLRVLL